MSWILKELVYSIFNAVCFALQRLATQINDMLKVAHKREERYPRKAKRETPTTRCVSIICAILGEHGKIVETVAYDFLFSHFLLS